LIWRESKAYRKMQDLKGIPKLYRVIDGLAIVVEEIQGKNLGKIKKSSLLPNGFIDTLKWLVDEIHRRGVAHCDLKRASNIILGNDGLPYIIDWGASISENEFGFPFLNAVYRRFILDDNMAIIKLKLRYATDTVTDEEMRCYSHRSTAEKAIRKIRDMLRNMLQRIA
jgi:serine/threonine protein kinase